jgi:hypothetical protein
MAMSSIEHVYWIIAIAASTVLAVQLIIACVSGLDFHVGTDLSSHDVGTHHDDIGMPHFQLLTIRNIVAFFALFGWSGLAFYDKGLPVWLVIFLSFICGLIMMVITALIFYGLFKLQSSGNVDYTAAKGLHATVYLKIPSAGQGSGRIKVILQEKIVEMEAITIDSKEIPTGSTVVIKESTNTNATVERVEA